MKQSYSIKGMTCQNCVANVKKALLGIKGVKEASIDLKKEEAILELAEVVPLDKIQESLSSKYTILSSQSTEEIEGSIEDQSPSKLAQLKPLFIILGYIFITSILLHHKTLNLEEIMIDILGLFFIVFSFFKILDLKGFSTSFSMYDPLAKVFPLYAYIYPFLEILLGLLFFFRWKIVIALVTTIIILSITTFGVVRVLLSDRKIKCACLGTALNLPMTEATFIENVLMIGMAFLLLI